MSVLAVMAVRNEAGYIDLALRSLIDDGIEVAVIDHASIDGTRERAEALLGAGVVEIVDLRWNGTFDLGQQLRAKRSVYEASSHDWHVHVDADEWLRAVDEVSLRDLFERQVDAQFDVVNFREFVFVPPDHVDMWGRDYRRLATRYYFFEPGPHRLMRAWRRRASLDNIEGAGHILDNVAPDRIFPQDQVLRHYVGLSWSHAIGRRANRVFSKGDLSRGWHGNRLDFRAMRIPESRSLMNADPWDVRALDTSAPSTRHFWESGFAPYRSS